MALQNPLLDLAPHLNRGLFSDHYLNEVIPESDEWQDGLLYAQAKTIQTQIRALLAEIQPEQLEEAQLEEQWIRPVLELLGHQYAVQIKVRQRKSYGQPDYVLVATEDEARAFTRDIYEPHQLTHVLAIVDAKRWGTHFDQSSSSHRNPSHQIDEYLRYSECKWGILTDGRYWRLYERTSSKYNLYYAVDLDTLLEGDTDPFLYFYIFFRQAAFTTGWLNRILISSEEFAEQITEQLEDEVYDALELIAQGFLQYRRNQLTDDPVTLRTIYEHSLVFLYRLLFLFYAESREILPMRDGEGRTKYRVNISLSTIKQEAVMTFKSKFAADSGKLYTMLRDLFFAIDAGSEEYDLAPYNGRLFSDEEYPFLADKVIGDRYLAPALDKLARVEVQNERRGKQRVFVDYRDLEVRHLGAIYERLLEYDLDVATQPLAVKGGKYVAAKNDDKVIKQPGEVYLRTGNNERKVTGSYYTPDYIVRFIVEHTLESLLMDITRQYATRNEDGTWQVQDADGVRDAILALNVLDPAIGSGHFLVEVTAYIAEWLRSLDLQPADIEGGEDELAYWKRQVVNACIYGVDINPLAVELAKVSLWLATLTRDKPLSFLDHHLRVGNSLVGAGMLEIDVNLPDVSMQQRVARRKAEAEAAGQLVLFDNDAFTQNIGQAVDDMMRIESIIAETVENVKQQEALYRDLTDEMAPWRQLADVWTARYFGLALTQADWEAVRKHLFNGETSAQAQAIIDEATKIAVEQCFFHWEFAFPEMFFNTDGSRRDEIGFDAVVGNPPYVRQERITPMKPYLETHYDVYQGTADLFLYFYEQGLRFVREEHLLGFVTSGTYMNSNSATEFRKYIHANAAFETVVNFGENQPFKGAEMVYPTIAILRRGDAKPTFRHLFVEDVMPRLQLGEALEEIEWAESLSEITAMSEWRFQAKELTALFKKINQNKETLDKVVEGRIYSGIKTGLNEAFVIDGATRKRLIDEHPSSAEIIKPMLRGQDLRPWYQKDSQLYLIWTYIGIEIESYPAIKNHLTPFRPALEKRADCLSGQCQWYELRPCNYYDEFNEAKIFWPDISKLPRFSFDENGLYSNDKCFFQIYDDKNLLSILNSRVTWFALSQIATPLRLRAGLWQYQSKIQFIKRLPIPELTAQQERDLASIAEEITALARDRYRLHENVRTIISADFGDRQPISTRVALYEWWNLEDDSALNDELQRRFDTSIPLNKRGEWRQFLAEQKAEHEKFTQDIIDREVRMNAIVYDAFKLTAEERALIEKATKYPYGEV
ncbi:MAG: hypothetical protein D6737_04715 [Chloroflexi bacterium]|nr:MAG: hypothetical protein D6737_04715 [Chloroflexota bacterium]